MNLVIKVALVVGGIGILIPCLVLGGKSDANIQIGIMISGALVFGSGVIASAIASKEPKE